jgi:hypothetical protein
MSKKWEAEMKTWTTVVSLGVIAGFAASAVADHDHDRGNRKRAFRAKLAGHNEVPAVSTEARGDFYAIANAAGTQITYWLTYSDLTEDAAQSHIHFGEHHVNGGIIVWLCQGTARAPGGDVPECAPRETKEPIFGTIDASEVLRVATGNPPAFQGIDAGEFAELLAAMRAGAAYVNVHSGRPGNATANPPTQTVGFPPGEIRGQVE